MPHKKALLIVSTALSLIACAPPMPAPEAPLNQSMSVEQRKLDIRNVNHWTISGAMATKAGNKGWSASVNWQQRGANNYKIRLYGPLGSGNVIISKSGSRVTLKDGNKRVSSNNAASLLKQQTGISVPVSSLYYWVRGIEAPGGSSNKSYDRYNHLKSLSQNGFRIDYQRYTSVGNTDLPSKIILTGQGVRIKFIIKKWQL